MEFNKESKISKNRKRKALRYGKKTNNMANRTDLELKQFAELLLKFPTEEDHSLDELEYKRRPWPLLPGSFEMGKRR